MFFVNLWAFFLGNFSKNLSQMALYFRFPARRRFARIARHVSKTATERFHMQQQPSIRKKLPEIYLAVDVEADGPMKDY